MRLTLAMMTLTAGFAPPTGVAAASVVAVPNPGGPAVFVSISASDVVSQLVAFTSLQFKDLAQPLTAGPGCVPGPPVGCPATIHQELHFRSAADRFRAFSNAHITISAGGGPDTIRAAGDLDTISGGAGDDDIWENGNTPGTIKGDAGNDEIYSYEADSNLQGGIGNDLLVSHSNLINIKMSGGDNDDQLVVESVGKGTLTGDAGNDTIVLNTQFGGFTADGGPGLDTIAGSAGKDKIFGGDDNDVINVTGGGVD